MKTLISFFLLMACFTSSVTASKRPDATVVETAIVLETKTGKIYGTLTAPQHAANIPVALIIAGSGPTDRDGNNTMMHNNSLKKLAFDLSKAGIAALRYDKRGIAESMNAGASEADLRFDNYVTDAEEWIQLLKNDKRFSRVIVIGHSEGSLIGMIAGRTADKFVSIAGAGESADKLIKRQLGNQPQRVQEMCASILDSLKHGDQVTNVMPMLYNMFRPSVQPYMISWFKYDPQIEIAKLTIPVLIVQGTNDLQVTVDDAQKLSAAYPKAQVKLIEKMNHVFKIVEGDKKANIAAYNNESLPNAPLLIKTIAAFIKAK
jgi:hypothetical protein